MEEEEMKEMKEVLFKTNMNEVITMIATKRESDNPNLNKFFKFEIYNTINNQFHNILKNHLKEKGKIKRVKRKIINQKLKLERIHGYKYILINNFNSQLIFEYIDKEEQNHDFFIDMVNDFANNNNENGNYSEDENEELNYSNNYSTTQINTQLRNNSNNNINIINHDNDINHNNNINININFNLEEYENSLLFEEIRKNREEEIENGSLSKIICN